MKSIQTFKVISLFLFWLFLNSCATSNTLIQSPPPDIPSRVVKISVIQNISFFEEENYTRIQIEGSETLEPPFYKLLSDPLRIAIDVPNIDLKQIKEPIKIDNGTVAEVLTTQYNNRGRIEIGLVQMTDYNILKEDKNLIIDIEKVKKIAEAKEEVKKEEAIKEKEAEITPPELKKEETPPVQPVGTASIPETLKKAKEILNFLLDQKKDFITFNIVADGRLGDYNAFKLDSPPRLVLDIWEVDTRYPKNSIKIKNPFIKKVRIGHHPDKLRLVFDCLTPKLPSYQINRTDDKLMVSFGNVPQPSEPQIYVQEKSVKESPATTPKVQAESHPKPGKPSTLIGIDFKQMDDKSRIILSLSTEDPQFESSTPSKNTIAIDVKNAFVPKRLLRGLDTSAFESVVNYIDLKNVKVGKANDIRVLVKLGEETPYETTKEGKEIFIDIKEKPKKIEAKVVAPPPEVKKEEVAAEVKKEEITKEEEVKKEEKPVAELKKEEMKAEEKPIPPTPVAKKVEEEKKIVEEERPEKVYKGRKLSLDFKDADIKNILRLIAEVSNFNIIAGDDVTGKITMRLVDVPWDQALDVILQARSLGMTKVGNVIRIAPLEALKKEIQAELEARRAKERLEDLVTVLIPVNYATAKEIVSQIKGILSERGDIKVDDRTNILIVKDIPRNIVLAKNLVKSLDAKTPQVLIEARIIEANLTFQRELGVKWGFLVGGGKATAGGGISGTSTLDGTTTTHKLVDLPAEPKVGTAGIVELLLSRGTIKELDIAISAHENKGDVKIISSPKIATLDNKEAYIEQGLRIPYIKYTAEGTATVDFIEANLKLTVTPHVTSDGHIKMNIRAKKDAPDTSITVLGTPSIDKKETATEVLIKDGGVVVIAGVYSIEKSHGGEGIPLFGKIPLLGWLFKRETKEDKRKDLLIFISPKIFKD